MNFKKRLVGLGFFIFCFLILVSVLKISKYKEQIRLNEQKTKLSNEEAKQLTERIQEFFDVASYVTCKNNSKLDSEMIYTLYSADEQDQISKDTHYLPANNAGWLPFLPGILKIEYLGQSVICDLVNHKYGNVIVIDENNNLHLIIEDDEKAKEQFFPSAPKKK